MKKRIVATLLSLCLLVGLFPTTALAVNETEDLNENIVEPTPAQPAAVDRVVSLVEALPDYADVTEDDLVDIYAAKEAYDALSDEEKAALTAELKTKLADLVELAAEIEALVEEQAEEKTNQSAAYLADVGEALEIVVDETGTLQAVMEAAAGYVQENVTNLSIATEPGAFLNYADFTYLRTQLPNLTRLDISEADCINDYDPANPVEHEIPRSAMNGHTALETIILSKKVTSIGYGAFSGCTGLRGDLVIPDNITNLSKLSFGFYGNVFPELDSLTLSRNLENIDAGAFLRCKIKGGLSIPASVEYIGGDWTYGGAFQACQFSGPLVFEENSQLKTISSYAFNSCGGLSATTENFPTTVETIGSYAFSGMKNLTGVLNLPSVISIGTASFDSCSGLDGVTFGENLVSIGKNAFNACGSMRGNLVIPDSTVTVGDSAFLRCYFDGTLTLGDSLQTIGGGAFEFNNFTGNLVIPDSVKTINSLAFAYSGFEGGTLTLGDNLEYIGGQAFREIAFTGDLVIPDSVTSLGDSAYGAFFGCGFDGTLKLSSSLKWIPDKAFYNCKNFTGTLVIPDAVETLGPSCFSGCAGFTGGLTIPDSVVEIGQDAFNGCAGLNGELQLGGHIQSIGKSAFAGLALSGEIKLPESLKTLGQSAFGNCKKLTGDVTLPAGLESIGTYAFNSTQITALRYHGDQITNLGDNAYFGTLSALKTLDFAGSKVEKLTWTASATALTSAIVPDTLTSLVLTTKSALETIDLTGCTNLVNVDLQNNAIDFSLGAPKQWLENYSGTKKITGQKILFHGEPGQTNRSIGVGETFEDDFRITTYHGTDLSTPEKWSAFRAAHQANVAPAADAWIAANQMTAAFPITRAPSYTSGINTGTAGIQMITYSTTNAMLLNLNYTLQLNVGDAGTPGGDASITVKAPNGSAISANGYTKYYGDTAFPLYAELKNLSGNVAWKVFEDNNGAKGANESAAVLAYDSETGLFNIKGAGTAWVTASIGETKSAAVKVVVNRATFSLDLSKAKSKTYGATDAVNFSYSLAGKYGKTVNATFTREAGEDVGTYQIWLYDLAELHLNKQPGDTGFADAYTAACKGKFEAENPNYTLALTYTDGQNKNFTINAQALGLSNVTLKEKTYDGTDTALTNYAQPVTGILANDLNNGVSVAVTNAFDSKDVKRGEDGTVLLQDGQVVAVLSGPKVKNYKLPNGYTSGVEKNNITWTISGEGDSMTITVKKDGLSAKINPKSVSCYIQPVDKVYDGTTAAAFESPSVFRQVFTGLIESEQAHIDSITAQFIGKNVGNGKEVILVSDEINLGNYTLPAFAADITPAPLSVTGLTASDKVYDGTVDAVLSGTPVINTDGVVQGDAVSIATDGELEGEFYDKNAGNKKSVIVKAGLGLTGEDAGNYYLQPANTMYATITPATLTIIPDADQYKSLGALDPTFTYTYEGLAESDKKEDGTAVSGILRGALSRVAGEASGEYAFALGSLTASSNYKLVLSADAPKFAIRDTDATLKAISVLGGTLTPTFNPEAESYTVKLPKGTTTVPTITAEASNSTATVNVSDAASLEGSTTITVTAADGQTTKTYTVSFAVAAAVSASASVVNASSGNSDGIIVATGSGGSGSYEFSLDNAAWQSGNTFDGKAAGSYTLYVRDAEDHSNTASTSVTVGTQSGGGASVPAPTTLTADPAVPVIPYSADSLNIQLTAGGVDGAVYRYYIYSGNGTINGNTLTVTAPGSVTVRAEAIKGGSISTQAKALTLNVTKAGAVSMTATPKAVTTYGGTNGSITMTVSGGLGTYQYRIGNGSWGTTSTFSGLTAGTYTVYVRDAQDTANVISQTVEVTQADATDAVAVNTILNQLTLGDTSAVTESLALPTSDNYGGKTVSISWATSDSVVVSADGTVTRPSSSSGNKTVTLTATLALNGITKTKTFEVTVIAKEAYSGGSSSSSSSSNTKTTTVKNPDGSTTTTVINKTTGVTTVTTKAKDGTTVVETTDKKGNTTVTANVPSAAINAAKGEAVTLPTTVSEGDSVKITTAKAAKVEIPVEDVTPGTVAVIVDAKGNEKIVATSVVTEDGIVLTVSGTQTVKVIDNSKSFTDVPKTNVFYNEIASLSAREIMVGKTNDKFDLYSSVTLNQIANVAGRIVGAVDVSDFNGGIAWGAENGLKTGNVPATRGDVLKALYIAAGSPTVEDTSVLARFTDSASIPADLTAAAAWAAQNGILKGNVDGSAGLGNNVTRGQACALAGRTMATLA